ncbi:MAG: hypothetical protein M5U31_00875 [Acidimicrobiia bacterium]|nr:hypothetical protein [Acidimicrobiia bacterium]
MNASKDLTEGVTCLEDEVAHALETGDVSGLEILGYGEISVVVALETDEGRFACKRLPASPTGRRSIATPSSSTTTSTR